MGTTPALLCPQTLFEPAETKKPPLCVRPPCYKSPPHHNPAAGPAETAYFRSHRAQDELRTTGYDRMTSRSAYDHRSPRHDPPTGASARTSYLGANALISTKVILCRALIELIRVLRALKRAVIRINSFLNFMPARPSDGDLSGFISSSHAA